MPLWEAVLLGIVQGITEFLPVSSDGHLVIAGTLLGVKEQGLVFVIAVHVGSLLALLVFYRARVIELVSGVLRRSPDAWRYTLKLAIATLPAVVVGLFFRHFVERMFQAPWTAGAGLFVSAAFLATTRATQGKASGREPSYWQALWIGTAQALAIAPGISRSALTISSLLLCGVAPLAAAEFSFLLGIIAIVGAAVLELPETLAAPADAFRTLWVGAAAAAVTGFAALLLLVRLLRSRQFHWFAVYDVAAGLAFLIYLALR